MSKIIYNIKPFGTIEELTLSTFDFVVGDIVDLQGYYTAGDGAHHKRKIEGADDGSGVQLANGLWANIVHNGEVNVSWFGAKGDGVTDDTSPFQKVSNMHLFKPNQRIFINKLTIPSGVFVLTDTIRFFNPKGIAIVGDTYNATVLKFVGTGFRYGLAFEDIRPLGQGHTGWQYGVSVINLTISTDETEYKQGFTGLFVEKLQNNWTLKNFRVTRCETGLFIGVHSEFGRIDHCIFRYNKVGANAYGTQSDLCNFINCVFGLNFYRDVILSATRQLFFNTFFGGYSEDPDYIAVEVCHQQLRDEDVGKSDYLTGTDSNSSGDASKFIGCHFEGGGNVEGRFIVFNAIKGGEDFSIDNCKFACYDSSHAISLRENYSRVRITNCTIVGRNSSLIEYPGNIITNVTLVGNIGKIYDEGTVKKAVNLKEEYYDLRPGVEAPIYFAKNWNLKSDYVNDVFLDINYKNTGQIKVTNTSSLVKSFSLYKATVDKKMNILKVVSRSESSSKTLIEKVHTNTKITGLESSNYSVIIDADDEKAVTFAVPPNSESFFEIKLKSDESEFFTYKDSGGLYTNKRYDGKFEFVPTNSEEYVVVSPLKFICKLKPLAISTLKSKSGNIVTITESNPNIKVGNILMVKSYSSSLNTCYNFGCGREAYKIINVDDNVITLDTVVTQITKDGTDILVVDAVSSSAPYSILQLNTPYHALKMQQLGIYEDFITYMDEQHEYERHNRELEEQRQLEFESRENQEQTYEDWLSTQPQSMPFAEPQPSQALLDFKKKYLG